MVCQIAPYFCQTGIVVSNHLGLFKRGETLSTCGRGLFKHEGDRINMNQARCADMIWAWAYHGYLVDEWRNYFHGDWAAGKMSAPGSVGIARSRCDSDWLGLRLGLRLGTNMDQ